MTIDSSMHAMQTIPDSSVLKSDTGGLRRPELALWAAAMLAVCLCALQDHIGSGTPQLAVQVADAASSVRPAVSAWRLDINTASAQELEMLPGIGVRRAAAILQARNRRGGFSSVWELCEVPGLTRALVQRLEPLLQAAPPAPPIR